MKYLSIFFAAILFFFLTSCGHKGSLPVDTDVLHANEDALTHVIIYDVFTPPVAARIYAYTNLASYEAMKYADPKLASITAQLRGFDKMPEPNPGKSYNYALAATK